MITRLFFLFSISLLPMSAYAQWIPDGTALGGGGGLHIVTNGAGGALATWEYWDPWALQWDYGMAQHVGAAGNQMWQPGGKILCQSSDQNSPQVVSDGAGGAIFVWFDNRNGYLDLYAQRIDASGAEQWSPCGVPVRVLPIALDPWRRIAVVEDGSGGVIIVWSDPRGATPDIYAQHLNAAGTPLWTVNGAALCFAADVQLDPIAVADGLGGVWVAWSDSRNGNTDVYARHINAAGLPEGAPGGLALCTAAGAQYDMSIASDEAGGAIVAWQDERAGIDLDDVYAQRVSLAGTLLWTADGAVVCNQASIQERPNVASDGAGGAVVVWKDWRTYPDHGAAFVQRLNSAGQPQWTADGNLLGLSERPWTIDPVIIADDAGETIVAWDSARWNAQIPDMEPLLLVQRLGADGAPQWTPQGVELRNYVPGWPGDGGVAGIELVSDGWGGVIAAWTDGRYWQASDVRIGHVSPSGAVTDITPTRGPSLMAVDVYPNPFSGTAKVAIELSKPSQVEIDVFDVAGRRVRSLSRAEGNLSHVVDLTDRDDAGQVLASGVYFCRVRAATGTVTRKIVIAR